ncbi:MAG TPA: gluconate 2-dehydrogenase subunit 3 family protein [Streptosporangiaceae bacterium]|nr:gluconate 2-dehydrogenase subunit 3 family protein [Streptosporangiaceae bacterium]
MTARFPGFDVLGQAPHWDQVTADVVTARCGPQPEPRFFTPAEQDCASALLDQLTGQRGARVAPVLQMVDARLAAGETDGWRYADMPEDSQAWRDSLGYLDKDASLRCGSGFADASDVDQMALLQAVLDLGTQSWHGLPAAHVWSLWTRYACTALYSHPAAWAEMGFPGPAYPRGYKNAGVGKLEPFEVADAQPSDDPVESEA